MGMQDWEGVLVPLIVFSTIVALVGLVLHYEFRKKRAFLRHVQANQAMNADLGDNFFARGNDRRRGIFFLGSALAIFGFSLLVDFPQRGNLDLNDAINGFGMFPLMTGLGYLLLYRLDKT